MSNNNQLDEIIDLRQFFYKIINSWHFFGLSLLIAFSIAFLYNRYTKELYLVESSILVKENNSIGSASDLLFENAMGSSKISLENKVLVLKSFPLVYSTLADLGFDISYSIAGNIKESETFIAPIKIKCNDISKLIGKNIIIEYIDVNKYNLIYDDYQKMKDLILKNNLIKKEGCLIIEHDHRTSFKDENVEVRKYGAVHFSIFSF